MQNTVDIDGPALDIYPARLAEQHRGIALAAQDVPQRRGNGRRGETGGRHLIKQRLKSVMIAAVDEQDVHGSGTKGAHGGQAAEAAADNDNTSQFPHLTILKA